MVRRWRGAEVCGAPVSGVAPVRRRSSTPDLPAREGSTVPSLAVDVGGGIRT